MCKQGRPFYTEFAWAYDLIIENPIARHCDFIEKTALHRNIQPGSKILDAGCGTGNYSIELAQRGFIVTGIDASKRLITLAKEKAKRKSVPVTFRTGDILKLTSGRKYDGILCRGVLNDIIKDQERQQVFASFANVIRKAGSLVLDVREWKATANRKEKEPIFEKVVEGDRKLLWFRSEAQLDYETRQLRVSETHTVKQNKHGMAVTEYHFVMKCWTIEELHHCLATAGFGCVEYFGDYSYKKPVGTTDRIVAVATYEH